MLKTSQQSKRRILAKILGKERKWPKSSFWGKTAYNGNN